MNNDKEAPVEITKFDLLTEFMMAQESIIKADDRYESVNLDYIEQKYGRESDQYRAWVVRHSRRRGKMELIHDFNEVRFE